MGHAVAIASIVTMLIAGALVVWRDVIFGWKKRSRYADKLLPHEVDYKRHFD